MKLKRILLGIVAIFVAVAGTASSVNVLSEARSYVIPSSIEGVKQHVLLLNGEWSFCYSQNSRWTKIQVPGEPAMQGYAIGHDTPFSKADGLIDNATLQGQRFIEKGPYLNLYINLNHLSGAEVRKIANHIQTSGADWRKSSMTCMHKDHQVEVGIS